MKTTHKISLAAIALLMGSIFAVNNAQARYFGPGAEVSITPTATGSITLVNGLSETRKARILSKGEHQRGPITITSTENDDGSVTIKKTVDPSHEDAQRIIEEMHDHIEQKQLKEKMKPVVSVSNTAEGAVITVSLNPETPEDQKAEMLAKIQEKAQKIAERLEKGSKGKRHHRRGSNREFEEGDNELENGDERPRFRRRGRGNRGGRGGFFNFLRGEQEDSEENQD